VAALLAKWLHLSRLLALSLVVLFGLDLCALFIWLAGPQVTQQIQQLGEQLPQSITLLQHRLENPTGV
jgi:predicted PurR-regulated permease PerM